MREQHTYVPGHNTERLVRTMGVGDLLSVERSQNAQDDLQDSTTPSARLEGLIPALADFHTYGNFLEVTYIPILHTPSVSRFSPAQEFYQTTKSYEKRFYPC